jgi:uncharacterized membrane protein YfcA
MSLLGLAIVGSLDLKELVLAALLIPALELGFLTSRVLHQRLDPSHWRPAVLAVCSAGALVLLVRSLF